MRARIVMVLGVIGSLSLAACDRSEPAAPTIAGETIDLVPDYAVSAAASVDAAGIGAADLPESLRLTTEQKAAIAALHEQFMRATAADVAALKTLEAEARAARAAGKSRQEVGEILARAIPIRARLEAAFTKLRADVWAVYTPEQRAWIESHRPRACTAPRLTEDQVRQIRILQEQFVATVKPDLDVIRAVAEEARAARAAGKSREEVATILAKAAPAQQRVVAAERALQAAILALLTPEQRQHWSCRR